MHRYQDKGIEPIERLREAFKGKKIEEALKKVSRNNGTDITEDELLIGMA